MKLHIHFQTSTVHALKLGNDNFHPTLYLACDYLSMLGLKLIHVLKGAPRRCWQMLYVQIWNIALKLQKLVDHIILPAIYEFLILQHINLTSYMFRSCVSVGPVAVTGLFKMAWRLFVAKPTHKPMLFHHHLESYYRDKFIKILMCGRKINGFILF